MLLFAVVDSVIFDVIFSFENVRGWVLRKIVRDLEQVPKGMSMKFKVGLFSIIIFLLFISCNINGNNGDIELVSVSIGHVEITERINFGQTVYFTMRCGTPTPGYKFHHTEISKSGFDIYVKVYAEKLKGIWIQIPVFFITSVRFKPDSRGNYTFHFYQVYPSEYLVKIVDVQ